MTLDHLKQDNELIFKTDQQNYARVTLNRPTALNALSYKMIEWIRHILVARLFDGARALVFDSAGGRAFCAGGDIKAVHAARGKDDVIFQYFGSEYAMNSALFHLNETPTIALMNGITMGGGYGVAGQCKIRIATSKTVFAMPETAIGFFPDVGAAYHLARFPGATGMYLGLTGISVASASDLLYLGVATHFVFDEAYEAIAQDPLSVLSTERPLISKGIIEQEKNKIDAFFSKGSVRDIFQALEDSSDPWAQETLVVLKTRCPVSLLLTFEHISRAKTETFDCVIERDFSIAQHVMGRADFFEGVRAAVIDKDKAPKWDPATLDEVPESLIFEHLGPAAYALKDILA